MKIKYFSCSRSTLVVIVYLCILSLTGTAKAQSVTDGATPSGIAPGSPSGSYALSGFDNINLYNGNLDVRLKVLNVGGRGDAAMTVGVGLNPEPWVVKGTGVTHDWWSTLKPGYGPGVMQGRRVGLKYDGTGQTCPQDGLFHYRWTRTSLTFTASDGTEFELWDKQSGRPWIDAGTNYCSTGPSRGYEFVTHDGSSATFISDSEIIDRSRFAPNTEPIIFPSGYLVLRDGTRYRIISGLVDSMRDRNGNRLTFSYGLNSGDPLTYRKVLTITDSLNRVVSFQYFSNSDVITFKGFNGATRTITITRNSLSSALRTDFQSAGVKKPSELFVGISPPVNETVYNPGVITSITMPDSRSYQIQYNQYAEVARVVLPTGGAVEYDTPGSGLVWDESTGTPRFQILRRVGERRAYTSYTDSTPAERTTYSADGFNVVTVDRLDPQNNNQLLSREKHYFFGDPVASLFVEEPSTPGVFEAREYKVESFNVTNGTVGTVLRTVENQWEPGVPITPTGPSCNGRLKQITTTLGDTNQVAKTIFGYDDTLPFNNQNNIKEYDFGAQTPLRETRITYVTSTNYINNVVGLVSLPLQRKVFDGNGVERTRTTFEYDNYTLDGSDCAHAFHCGLQPRSSVTGFDSTFDTSYSTRGNITATTNHLLDNGTVVGSITSYIQYDVLGNALRLIDPRSTLTNIISTATEYDDRFGSPDGNARANSSAGELGSLSTFAFPTKTTNAMGHISYTQRDYYLGVPIDMEDANGIVSTASCGTDLLDRPRWLIRDFNGGTTTKSQTNFVYDDVARSITTTRDQTTFNDEVLKSEVLYDGFGRTTETRQYEGVGAFTAVRMAYDAFGRIYKTSNPFAQNETPVWTITAFDALGRVTSVTTPDNAAVLTAYNGNSVTVTDQAGKVRKTTSDGLGRLTQVSEDPNGVDYQTTYLYDVLDNLVQVTQGSQQRFFMYDSLQRLIRSRNPEQDTRPSLDLTDPITGNSSWSTGYDYDAASNQTHKTDPRGIESTTTYDVLNRVTSVNYSNTTIGNPDVPDITRFYDGATNGKGRFWYSYKAGNISVGNNVEHTAIDTYDTLGRPLVQRQLFKLNGTWSPTYQLTRTYDLAGSLKSQLYPSGNSVAYIYDGAGRTSTFSGNLAGSSRIYSNNISYSPFGGLAKEQFGTDTALYHKLFYNIRGQLFDARLSSVNDTWDWNRGRLILYYSNNHLWGQSGTDNNGNLRIAETWIPPANATLDQADTLFEDTYSYDALNRLTSVVDQKTSVAGGWGTWQQQFRQQYTYDRWGNRTIDAAQTSGTGINSKQFSVDTVTNRLGVPSGQSGTMGYDAAGNLINDTYTGAGAREYDAENKMTRAWGGNSQWQEYTYNADGQRVRRKIDGQETWQIYGMDGDLLAEYAANGSPSTPQKEYGYRNGQLLITAEPATSSAAAPTSLVSAPYNGGPSVSLSWTGSGASQYRIERAISKDGPYTAAGSSTTASFIDNGVTSGTAYLYKVCAANSQNACTSAYSNIVLGLAYAFTTDPVIKSYAEDPVNVTTPKVGHITELRTAVNAVRTLAGRSPATWTNTNLQTGVSLISVYDVRDLRTKLNEALSDLGIPLPTYTDANLVGFSEDPQNATPIKAEHIRQLRDYVRSGVGGSGGGGGSGPLQIHWLVTDQLGTPRMIVDQTGLLANLKRHDYLPFGEEILAPNVGRTTALGYSAGDNVRQQFTSKERDVETGLDYFLARYYSSIQGRFTSPDEFSGGPDELYYFVDDAANNPTFYADLRKPQSLNKYQYAYNNPLRYIDPDGHDPEEPDLPQDPKPVVPLPPIAGMPPLVVPPTTTTAKGPTDAEIIEGGKAVLDTVADYTGITWIADKIRPYCPFCPQPKPPEAQPTTTTQPAPTTATPPQTATQPQARPQPTESRGRGRARSRGKGNQGDTGLRDKSDADIKKGARDRSIPKSERQRYKKEEKFRKQRNRQKREDQ